MSTTRQTHVGEIHSPAAPRIPQPTRAPSAPHAAPAAYASPAAMPRKPNCLNIVVLVITPILAATGLALYIPRNGVEWIDIALFFSFYMAAGLGITMGYHRYYSHRAFECHPVLQFFMLLFGAVAMQNSLLAWASDHRRHHRHEDTELDPYNIGKGFFWAHMGWIFFEDRNRDLSNVKDLAKQTMVRLQHRLYVPITVLVGFGVPFLIGLAFDRPWGGLLWGGLVRVVVGHHVTFLINSAAHYFGKQPHSDRHTARDSWWLGIVAFGEGYHNFHHTYPSDYRNGHRWYHYDIGKWLIGGLSYLGLTWGLRRTAKT